jgi:hypothetical protein
MNKLILLFSIPAIAALLAASCTTDGIDTASPVVSSDGNVINVAGVYRNEESSPIVSPTNSGLPVIQIDLRQNGSSLEGIDNNGKIFRGTLGRASEGNRASFNMTGQTTDGKDVTISGTILIEGIIGTMSGTWIEPDRYATILAKALGPSVTSNTTAISISFLGSASLTNGQSKTFSAIVTGNPAPVTWSATPSNLGSPTSKEGNSFTFTASSSTGTVTITAIAGSAKEDVQIQVNQ